MESTDIAKVKGHYSISLCGEHIVFYGSNLRIYRNDGTLIAYKNVYRNIKKILPLDLDKLLIDCGSQKAYIVLSLTDGSEIWRVKQPKLDYTSRRFSVSPDKLFVFDSFDLMGNQYLVRINLDSQVLISIYLEKGLRCISDMCFDDDGTLCLLEHHYETIAGRNVSINGIRYIHLDSLNPGGANDWKEKWYFDHPTISKFFLGNAETVLTQNLMVYHIGDGKLSQLLLDDLDLCLSSPLIDVKVSNDSRYITLIFNNMNIIVSTLTRKIVARYATNFYHGCLIDNEYWICLDSGTQKRSFPSIEEIRPEKADFWQP